MYIRVFHPSIAIPFQAITLRIHNNNPPFCRFISNLKTRI